MKRLIPLCLCLLLAGCAGAPAAPATETTACPETLPSAEATETTVPVILSPEEVILSRMTLRQKVGQLFMVRPDALDPDQSLNQMEDPNTPGVSQLDDGLAAALKEYPVGGFVQFSRNIRDPQQLLSFNTQLSQSMEIPPFLAVDEEGGAVARLASHPAFQLPRYQSAGAVGSSGNSQDALEMGRTIGTYLKDYGFHMDFAPVADVNTNPQNPVIGTRSFSSDPVLAADCAQAMAQGLRESGILPVFKHFPGHGDTRTDSHTGGADSYKNMDQLESCELLPFRSATAQDCIMVGHIGMPEVTGDHTPATLSYAITTGILRNHLDFQGLIITDSLSMGAITQMAEPGEAAVQAFQAGADILLMPQSLPQAFGGILEALESGEISQQRLDSRVLRILRFKIDSGILIPS